MKEFKVIFPEDRFLLLEYVREDLPGVAIFNAGLVDFEPREVFGYQLALSLFFEDLLEQGMPTEVERMIADNFEDELMRNIKGPHDQKPNALYVGRTTWNGTRDIFFRVFDPEPVHHYLQEIIHSEKHPREFQYEMEFDPEWKLSEWQLEACRGK